MIDPRATPDDARNYWQYIIVHHSASPSGNAAIFDRLHRSKGWDGVGYHFVIGNGKGSGDGALEVTPRWRLQKHGAHAGKLAVHRPDERNCCNEFGIGVCLVGNYEQQTPSQAQMRTLAGVIAVLQNEYGIASDDIAGHGHVKSTACPGGRFPWRTLFSLLEQPLPARFAKLTAQPTTERCLWCLSREVSGRGVSAELVSDLLME